MEEEKQRYNDALTEIFSDALDQYGIEKDVESIERIPTVYADFPLETDKWLRIDNVTCVFIDMKNSTQLSAQKQDKSTAGIYQYFTDTAVRILNHFGSSYIDVRGDGAFGLFDYDKVYHALASAVTFKSFSQYEIGNNVKLEDGKICCHIGMDRKTVLVKRIGLRNNGDKTSKQNEVWAGKPVNMASKLASRGEENDLLISKRVFDKFHSDGSPLVLETCGCNSEKKSHLWDSEDVTSEPKFDFNKIYKLKSPGWCLNCGQSFCEDILKLDKNDDEN